MDGELILGLVARWLHVLAAITAVGGTIFARLIVVPSLDELPPEPRAELHASMRRRWSLVVAAAIGLLIVSGLYNIGLTSIRFRLPRWYMPVFVVKFMLAFVIFAVASLLAGKTPLADRLRRNVRFWLNFNIALAVAVVCLSGILRLADRIPKEPPAAAATRPDADGPEKRFAPAAVSINLEFKRAGAGTAKTDQPFSLRPRHAPEKATALDSSRRESELIAL